MKLKFHPEVKMVWSVGKREDQAAFFILYYFYSKEERKKYLALT